MSLPNLENLRGMSDPFYFSFNVLKSGRLLCHAVIFTSFEVAANRQLKICTLDDDPRMIQFVHFIKANYEDHVKVATESVASEIKAGKELLERVRKEVAEIDLRIKQAKQQRKTNDHTKTT